MVGFKYNWYNLTYAIKSASHFFETDFTENTVFFSFYK
jgi:hypothetical protein